MPSWMERLRGWFGAQAIDDHDEERTAARRELAEQKLKVRALSAEVDARRAARARVLAAYRRRFDD